MSKGITTNSNKYAFIRSVQTDDRRWRAFVGVKNRSEKGRRVAGQVIHRTEGYRRKNQCKQELKREGLID